MEAIYIPTLQGIDSGLHLGILDKMFNRATPQKWMKYINAKTAIQMMLIQKGEPPLASKIRGNIGVNNRTGEMITLDTSRLKIGKHAFLNRLMCLREVIFHWQHGINKDRLRIELKMTFFVYLMEINLFIEIEIL